MQKLRAELANLGSTEGESTDAGGGGGGGGTGGRLRAGEIPDATVIHQARQRRAQMRAQLESGEVYVQGGPGQGGRAEGAAEKAKESRLIRFFFLPFLQFPSHLISHPLHNPLQNKPI